MADRAGLASKRGATADGRPYLVMEFVEGRPLTEWCDARGFGTKERLRIFLEVCAAVQYAHQHLVVHRDLKPANILVTEGGTVKLLDFGIAKVIGSDSIAGPGEQTATLFRLMTPDYASPEQVRGETISTASDVYALGVVLYELLVGDRPYRISDTSPAEMLRIVCEKEPSKPSAAAKTSSRSRELAGDLDTIVLTALRKEPGRRFASVGALADDIRRYLAGLPVEARTDAIGYRAGKFVRRHRAAVAAAALVATALAGGLVMTLREARRARAAEVRAERRFNEVRRLAHSNLFEFHDAIQNLPGSTPARELLVKRALEYLDGLAREKGADPGLQRELAAAYEKVGDVLGKPGAANLGDTAGAQASYRKALAIRQGLAASDPGNRDAALELAQSYRDVSEPGKALEILERVARKAPTDLSVMRALEQVYFAISVDLADRGDFDGALRYRSKESTAAETIWKAAPADRRAARNFALANRYVAGVLQKLGRVPEALTYYRKAAEIDEPLSAGSPAGSSARLDLSYDYGGIAGCFAALGDLEGALRTYRDVLALRREVADADPRDANARAALTRANRTLALTLGKSGDLAGALAGHMRALEAREELARLDPADAIAAYDVSESLVDIAELQEKAAGIARTSTAARGKHWIEASAAYRRAQGVLLRLQQDGKLKGSIEKSLASVEKGIERCRKETGDR